MIFNLLQGNNVNIQTDALGIPIFSFGDLFDVVYSGYADKINNLQCKDSTEIQKFNRSAELFSENKLCVYNPADIQQSEFDELLQREWLIPEYYQIMDIEEYVRKKCKSDVELERVNAELAEYNKRQMFPVLRLMVFLIDFMREKSIVWGVGRGSSVSSYVLYLIGVHRVDSIKYELDFREFLRNEE